MSGGAQAARHAEERKCAWIQEQPKAARKSENHTQLTP